MHISKIASLFILVIALSPLKAQISLGVSTSYSLHSTGKQSQAVALSQQRLSDQIQYLGQDNAISFGLSNYASFDKLYFRTDIEYTSLQREYAISSLVGTEGDIFRDRKTYTEQNHFIRIPISAGLQIDRFQVGLGPVFNFTIDQDDNLVKNTNLSHSSRSFNTGFQYFLGYKLTRNIHINVSLEQSLSNLGNDFIYNDKGAQLNIRPVTLRFGAAYFFKA